MGEYIKIYIFSSQNPYFTSILIHERVVYDIILYCLTTGCLPVEATGFPGDYLLLPPPGYPVDVCVRLQGFLPSSDSLRD